MTQAMSERNVEVVRRGFEALNGGVEAFIEFVDPEFETETSPELTPEPDVYRGYDGVRRYFASFEETMEEIRFEPGEFIEVGDRVLVPVRLSAKGKETGITVEQRLTTVWVLRDGKAVRIESYATEEQARRAAGLATGSRRG